MEPSHEIISNHTTQFRGILTPEGTIRAANEAVLEFVGSDKQEVIGTKLWEVPGAHLSERTQYQVHADVRMAAKGEFVNHELAVEGAERTALVDFSLQPLADEFGDVTHLIAEGYEMTALKQPVAATSQTSQEQTETDLLVRYSRDGDELMSEAILQAFFALDIDVFDMETSLQDWINTDSLDGFDWDSVRPLTITTRLWGYSVELTADDVRIYGDSRS